MRTTVRIDDDLLRQLKRLADAQKVSLTRMLNQVLRRGLAAKSPPKQVHREKVFSLGRPRLDVDLNKALALAAADEDAEVVRKIAMRK